ncbi:hypothetical protein M0805_002988 [Coniferiporia weirii]|nr:hypothetical protein M0805_002988 [Coniferiporia weirii]
MSEASPLGPIDPSSVTSADQESAETEVKAPWIVRKLVGSMTGRIVMSSYESLRAAGTSVVCLSPWGDSSPIFLPCIRFRDLVVHAVIAGTGGVAAVAAPVMGPVSDAVVDTFGDSLLVEFGLSTGFDVSTKIANDLLLVTLKYKHTLTDAQLGFFRSSVHRDTSLFADVRDYLATEKGWFSPYLFASGRRPVIPRSMKLDVIFCHGPFLAGDYKMGALLLKQSAPVIFLCEASPADQDLGQDPPSSHAPDSPRHGHLYIPSLTKYLPHARSRSPSPVPALAPVSTPPRPRRLVVLLLALAPHRAGLWSTSARPGESVLEYTLFGGCPALVLPARAGAPLLAWDALTLAQLHELYPELPSGEGSMKEGGEKFKGVVNVLSEYMSLCVDWERVQLERGEDVVGEEEGLGLGQNTLLGGDEKKDAVRNALGMLVAAAVYSKDNKQVKKEIDADRAGIVIFRIP